MEVFSAFVLFEPFDVYPTPIILGLATVSTVIAESVNRVATFCNDYVLIHMVLR